MIVMKFGGTSVEDARAMRNVASIIRRELPDKVFVVLSACAGVTNSLLRAAKHSLAGSVHKSLEEIRSIQTRHRTIAHELGLDAIGDELEMLLGELESRASHSSVERSTDAQVVDEFASFGERLSTLLLTRFLQQEGIVTTLVDAREIMITDKNFTSARPHFDLVNSAARQKCLPLLERGVVVTQGFLGGTPTGERTTIGRGGSDYSAAIFGAALGAQEIQIWTDVDGILSADPTLIPEALHIKQMTFREAAELAYFGAKVLHPKTILPAIEHGIPVRVLNSRKPDYEGTLIARNGHTADGCIVKSIAYKEGITLVNIESTRMLMAHGFLARVFDIFSQFRKSIDVIATSEIGVSLTLDDSSHLEEIRESLSHFADVEILPERAVLCVVGENMRRTKGVAAKIFAALDRADVNAELISHGGSEINLTVVIREAELARAVRSLHEELFPATVRFQPTKQDSNTVGSLLN